MTTKLADPNDALPEPDGDPNQTIVVADSKHPDGHYRINRSDFDAKKHKLYIAPKSKGEKE